MQLPSSISKADFVHNTAAYIPFSYGTPLSSETRERLSDSSLPRRPGELRRKAVGDSRSVMRPIPLPSHAE